MKIQTALNHRDRFVRLSQDIYSRARSYGLTHAQILATFKSELLDNPAWRIVPQWVKAYVEGYRAALFEQTYRRDLVWRVYLDGRYLDSKDVPEGRWPDVDGESSCHFWKENGKPYGDSKEERKTK
jgi:hypothetical protein